MKKILAILALIIMVTILASCGANKEGSKAEEGNESTNVESAEKAAPNTAEAPVAAPAEAPVAAPIK